jgi:hypothetical protein
MNAAEPLPVLPKILQLSEDQVLHLRKAPGSRVIGLREVPATVASPDELWPFDRVREWLVLLVKERKIFDAEHAPGSCSAAERVWGIASMVCSDPSKVLEFRRIYGTTWDYALSRKGTKDEDIQNLMLLIEEARVYRSQASAASH